MLPCAQTTLHYRCFDAERQEPVCKTTGSKWHSWSPERTGTAALQELWPAELPETTGELEGELRQSGMSSERRHPPPPHTPPPELRAVPGGAAALTQQRPEVLEAGQHVPLGVQRLLRALPGVGMALPGEHGGEPGPPPPTAAGGKRAPPGRPARAARLGRAREGSAQRRRRRPPLTGWLRGAGRALGGPWRGVIVASWSLLGGGALLCAKNASFVLRIRARGARAKPLRVLQ